MHKSSIYLAGVVAIGLFSVVAASAGEDDIQLMPGPGLETVQSNCSICHSLDYIQMNSPIFDEAGWRGSVTKMVNAFGAPITPEDQAVIVTYLAAHYAK